MNILKYSLIVSHVILSVSSVTARADDRSTIRSESVIVGDVDLNSAAGQRVVQKRIDRAVENSCPDRFERDLRRQMRARSCQQVARTSAVEGLAAYQARKSAGR